ncbi:MAG: ribosome-binding factor RbfA [Alphaproteobacteria bacterium]|jgi:ribosome-binding factor A|nr:ribosome-binding factor RbfA [Alphaproteobacteria bacterium]
MSKQRNREHSQRQLRVGEELRHGLAELLERGDMRDPVLRDARVTVTVVDVSPDLRNATAFIVPLGGEHAEEILAAMRRAAPYFRNRLAKMIELRFAPEIRFELDRSFDHAAKIDRLLHDPQVARDLESPDESDSSKE